MSLRVPKTTRIILIPEDDRSSREYTISRRMVIFLCALILVLTAVVIFVLVTYSSLAGEVGQAADLRRELAGANARLATVTELERELERMRSLQERLLTMLGVQLPSVAAGDTLAYWPEGEAPDDGDTAGLLERAAALVLTPPPDLWPAGGFVTREFRAGDPIRGVLPHQGIDIAAPEEMPIVAAGKGRIMRAGWDEYLGNFVEIQHGFGYVTVYGHCSRHAVREGDRVDRGQVIGYLGRTGEASAPHLHFEVWKEGEAIDPRKVIPGDPPR